MARTIRLRPWQKLALDQLLAHPHPDFLAVATPGAGKTTFALVAAVSRMRAHSTTDTPRIIVVAPTAHLKLQWAKAAASLGLDLSPYWAPAQGRLPPDMHGIVTTYQQVSTSAKVLRGLCAGAFVILDEIHHAGDERAWGDSVRTAFQPAAMRLALSGTPFRSDTAAIPFLRYDLHEEAEADFEYGYADALRDGGVVRPAYFPRINGFMEWVAPDGALLSADFDDALDRTRSQQRLRTALSTEGEWLATVLAQAHTQLQTIRRTQPTAGGLVIAADQDHARAIARLFSTRLRVEPVLVLSDDPDASSRIARFAESSEPWIIAVRMVSEGVDIPRLMVGVFATTTTTELFFRQAVGRLVRHVRGWRRQRAYLFIPDDPRLRTWAAQIAASRRHSLARRRAELEADDAGRDGDLASASEAEVAAAGQDDAEQLSLFSAVSAVVTDGPQWVSIAVDTGNVFSESYEDVATLDALDERLFAPVAASAVGMASGTGTTGDGTPVSALEVVVELPGRAPAHLAHGGGMGGESAFERREALRQRNADRARDLARLTGRTHAQVNAELNRNAGITRIDEATIAQLVRRLDAADAWWRSLRL